ncbi:MAG: hypothetical protein HY553_11365 [Elusimicrobia bacterium]|nr:hypothetical protein [Elusimicrobiota bacterium]
MILRAVLFLVLAAGLSAAAEDPGFDPERYPESTPAAVVKKHPCKPGADGVDVKDVLFSLRIDYRPVSRPLPKPRERLLKRWTAKLNAEDQAARFTKELKLGRGSDAAWVATTGDALDAMDKELKPGEPAWFFVSFIGCVGSEPAFALDEFSPVEPEIEEGATSVII